MYKLIAVANLIWISAYYPPLRPFLLAGMLVMLFM